MARLFRLPRWPWRLSRDVFSNARLIHLAESTKEPPPPDDAAEPEAAPRKQRKPVGWSMIFIGVLVAVCVVLVWRRDGSSGVLEILSGDLWLFGEILPRVLAGCLLGAFITEILPHEKVSRALGPESGLKGLLIGTAFGAILPGGPFTAYPVAAALLTVGADFGATIAMVVSWTLDRLWPRGGLGAADFGRRFHAVADHPVGADPDPRRRARPPRLCQDVSEGRGE